MAEVWMVAGCLLLTMAAPFVGMLAATVRTDAEFRKLVGGENR